MNNTKLAIVGLLAVTVITAHGMNQQSDANGSIRRSSDPYFMDMHYAITSGHKGEFMEAMNAMEANGHAFEGEDYDNLIAYAHQKDFDHIGIMENTIYQKCTAAVLKDDTESFIGHLAAYGECLSGGHLYWLLDLARKVRSYNMIDILSDEYGRRGNPSPTDFE